MTSNNSSPNCLPMIYARQTPFTKNLSSSNHKPNIGNSLQKHRSQNERYIFTQLSLIVVAFILGYMPTAVYQVWTIESRSNTGLELIDYWFGITSYLCLRFSECLNPIIYNLGSSKMRMATKKLLKLKK